MMNSDNVQAGTVTLETLEKTGWVEWEEFPQEVSDDWHKSLGMADGLMNTENEFPSEWEHSQTWKDDQDRIRKVSAHRHASATCYPTNQHGLAVIGHRRFHGKHCQR